MLKQSLAVSNAIIRLWSLRDMCVDEHVHQDPSLSSEPSSKFGTVWCSGNTRKTSRCHSQKHRLFDLKCYQVFTMIVKHGWNFTSLSTLLVDDGRSRHLVYVMLGWWDLNKQSVQAWIANNYSRRLSVRNPCLNRKWLQQFQWSDFYTHHKVWWRCLNPSLLRNADISDLWKTFESILLPW